MKYSGKVLINEQSSPGARTTRNPHHRDNVNQAQGPRRGNEAAHGGKRADFRADKDARAPLADVIARAFAGRAVKDHIDPKLEGVKSDSKESFKRKR